MTSRFADRVLAVVAELPAGSVASYGEVAAEAGRPGAARAVGAVLRAHGAEVPWWRVVTASGRLVPGIEDDHARRLEAEGVACRDGHVR
jgi:methylated-DNA-protein-cysteine methyltransferase related protein